MDGETNSVNPYNLAIKRMKYNLCSNMKSFENVMLKMKEKTRRKRARVI